ncbi:MAG: glycosyltransferase family 2 protein [Gemmatimonadota bacterium]|nr:glycosyltransferase family 2 protein [Gemmatimonadota bacterium]
MDNPSSDPGAGTPPSRSPGISACVIAMDEADRIADCLSSLDICDEIIVVDAHSSDDTRDIAIAAGARVIERDWPGHREQKQFAVDQATHDWVLCLDADERLSEELKREIVAIRDGGFSDVGGWSMPRLSHHLGAWIRYGSWYPNRQLRLFDRRRGCWGGVNPHDRWETDAPVLQLRGDLLHFPYRDFDEHLRTLDRYSTISAGRLFELGGKAGPADIIIRPPLRFLRGFLLKRGFLLGWRGLVLAILDARSVRLKYTRLRALNRQRKRAGQG